MNNLTEHQIDHIVEPNEMGDDAHIENHNSPKCRTISNDVQIHLSNALKALGEV